jgi:hypothetical protein
MMLTLEEQLQAIAAERELGEPTDEAFRSFADRALSSGYYSDALLTIFDTPSSDWQTIRQAVQQLLSEVGFESDHETNMLWIVMPIAERATGCPMEALIKLWRWHNFGHHDADSGFRSRCGLDVLFDAAYEIDEYPGIDNLQKLEKVQIASNAWETWNRDFRPNAIARMTVSISHLKVRT